MWIFDNDVMPELTVTVVSEYQGGRGGEMPGRTECVHNTVKCNDQNQKMKMLGIVWIEKLIFKTMKFSLNTTLISIELNFKFFKFQVKSSKYLMFEFLS